MFYCSTKEEMGGFFSCELKKGLYYAKLTRYLPNPLEGSMT